MDVWTIAQLVCIGIAIVAAGIGLFTAYRNEKHWERIEQRRKQIRARGVGLAPEVWR